MPGTPGATKIVGAIGLLLTAALGWMFVVGPQQSALAAVRLEVAEARSQNVVLAQQLASLERQSRALGETRRAARGLAAKFPPTADLPGLFRSVTTAAVEAGIGARGVTTLAPTAPVMSGTDPTTGLPLGEGTEPMLALQTVSVSVTGTFDQTQRLLENLEQMQRAYMIASVALTGAENAGTFTAVITGEMFVMPPLAPPGQSDEDPNQTGG